MHSVGNSGTSAGSGGVVLQFGARNVGRSTSSRSSATERATAATGSVTSSSSICRGAIAVLAASMDNGYVPVLTVPIIDEQNAAINTENDDVVRVLQQALQADTVVNLIEAPGFLEDRDNSASLIKSIPAHELESREQQVEGRMKRKMLAVRRLFEHGASKVVISDGRSEHPVNDALAGKGTVIE